jgi:hypothetical protein
VKTRSDTWAKAFQARRPTDNKKKDIWDKAPVVTSVISSVVIALVGLYLSSSIQESQLAVTQANNAAQIEITSQKNLADTRIEELRLAGQLLDSLVSDDAKKRRIATLMLPSALSDDAMEQRILAALVEDTDQSVRVAAINWLGNADTQGAALILEGVRSDPQRPENERTLARDLATKVALNRNLPPNTAFLFASAPGGLAYELPQLQGGAFTHYLARGLAGEADLDVNGVVGIDELAKYVRETVPKIVGLTRGIAVVPIVPETAVVDDSAAPFLELSGSTEMEVVSLTPNANGGGRRALIVGVSNYDEAFLQLRYTRNDAENMAATFRNLGVATTLLLDPTASELRAVLREVVSSMDATGVFYFFFAGHGWSISGENMLGATDAKITDQGTVGAFSIEELKELLASTPIKASFAFFDVCRNEIEKTPD